MGETKRFRVVLPVEVAGRVYQHGEIVELDEEMAEGYIHALRALDDEEGEGK